MVKEAYEELQKQYGLPDYDVLDKDFEISGIDEDDFSLRNVRKKLTDKIDHVKSLIDDLFHPDNTFAALKESAEFSDEDRDNLIQIYQKLMFFYRRATELSIEDSDQLNADFINDFYKIWPDTKASVLQYIKRLKKVWNGDISTKEVVGYLG